MVVHHSPAIGADAADLFDRWWAWAATPTRLSPPAGHISSAVPAFIPALQVNLTVPCWSAALHDPTEMCVNPLNGARPADASPPTHNATNQLVATLNGSTAAGDRYALVLGERSFALSTGCLRQH